MKGASLLMVIVGGEVLFLPPEAPTVVFLAPAAPPVVGSGVFSAS